MNGDLAGRLDDAAAALLAVERRLRHALPAEPAGESGVARALQERWRGALTARADEAAATADRVLDAAAAVRTTHRRYAETDEIVAHRLRRSA
jgi:hypothetical protein